MEKKILLLTLCMITCFAASAQLPRMLSPKVEKRASAIAVQLDSILYKSDEQADVYTEKKVYSYAGDIITEIQSTRWEGSSDPWREFSKVDYAYDLNGNEILYLNYELVDDSWVYSRKEVYSYNNNGTPTLEASYHWDQDKQEWIENRRIDYSYDAEGMLVESYGFMITEDGDRMEMQLLPSGTPEHVVITINFKIAGVWTKMNKIEKRYTSDVKLLSNISFVWGSSDWIAYHKEEYEYDSNGNLLSLTNSNWENASWKAFYRNEYTYDSNNNKLSEKAYYASGNKPLQAANEIVYTYNSENKPVEEILYYWEGTIRRLQQIGTYFYNQNGTGFVQSNLMASISVFPNPATEMIYVKGFEGQATYSMTDISGMVVISGTILAGESVHIRELSKGVYVIELKTSKENFKSKIIVQ